VTKERTLYPDNKSMLRLTPFGAARNLLISVVGSGLMSRAVSQALSSGIPMKR